MAKQDYRFIDKDPIIDMIRTEAQRHGPLKGGQIERLAEESGVSSGTIRNWFFGETKRPQSLSTRFVLEALGVTIKYVREDGSTIRRSGP